MEEMLWLKYEYGHLNIKKCKWDSGKFSLLMVIVVELNV